MANSEDYLDGLLDSITKAKSDNENAAASERRERDRRVRNRTRVSADDDFMEANGLLDFEPETGRSNRHLRQIFGDDTDLLDDMDLDGDLMDDDEFLKEFENELSSDDIELAKSLEGDDAYDSFISDVAETVSEERKKASSLEDFSLGSIEDDIAELQDILRSNDDEPAASDVDGESGDEIPLDTSLDEPAPEMSLDIPEASDGEVPPEMSLDMPETSDEEIPMEMDMPEVSDEEMPLDDGGSEAIEGLDPSELEGMDGIESMPDFEGMADVGDASVEEIPLDEAGAEFEAVEIDPADLDAADTLMDESGEGMDLMDMLGEGDDLMGDIGALLNADDNLEELSEARSEFESQAEAVVEGGTDLESGAGDAGEAKKGGSFLDKIKAFIAGFLSDDEDEEEDYGLVNIASADPTMVELAAEDAEILEHFTDEETPVEGEEEDPKEKKKREKEEAKAAKKAAKEEAKKAKEEAKAAKAAEKAAKPKKEKKPKEPDNSPKVPIKGIIVNAVLGLSVVVLVSIAGNTLHTRRVLAEAANYYEKGRYAEAAVILDGMKLDADSDEASLALKARILSKLEHKIAVYDQSMKYHDYMDALDALISGTYDFVQNREAADDLKIRDALDTLGLQIEGQLMDQFGVSEDEAMKLYRGYTRVDYTRELGKILEEKDFK